MRVMVTGAAGFIGSWVVSNLLERQIEVIAFDRSQHDYAPGVRGLQGDVLDRTRVEDALSEADGVIHLAGMLGTAETVDDPWPAFEANVRGALNVFEACRNQRKRCSYISVGNYWLMSPYPISKTAAESLAFMFNNEYGTEIAVVRTLNAYGPGQKYGPHHPRKIMPNFVVPALHGEPITIFGDGSQIADMIWVGDVADILIRALVVDHGLYRFRPERDCPPPVKFHAGTGRPTTVNEIAQMVIEKTGSKAGVQHVPPRAGEPEGVVILGDPRSLIPLYSDLPALLPLETGIALTVGWYAR